MIRRRRILVISVAAIGFVLWNIAWPTSLFVHARRSRVIHSQKYCGEFSGVYNVEVSVGPDGNYVNTPFSRMPGERTRLKVSISSERIKLTTTWGEGYEFSETYTLGQDTFYLGNGRFVFYSTYLNFGQIMPGTIYATTECRVEVSPQELSVFAVEAQIGMGFFLIPVFHKTTFVKTFPSL